LFQRVLSSIVLNLTPPDPVLFSKPLEIIELIENNNSNEIEIRIDLISQLFVTTLLFLYGFSKYLHEK
jgi:hypothetical protein